MLDQKQIDEWKAIVAAATPGPWVVCGADRGGCACRTVWAKKPDTNIAVCKSGAEEEGLPGLGEEEDKANARLVAIAPEAIPALIAEIRRHLHGGDR